ncbi:hypothetical protein SAMN03159423_5787 [Bradyrhizobium sp. NFR13]|uniref:hypothetical protein n=1 Tax=Bradyrhizobium sp. NFR13 TaxID=1566285 RepID=UPI0008F2DACD|nr:hypothetical protein [Bradyrhizobium sp. NFR13]SFM17419.1 hypothetical protein SAMN03159423_5787 [Bradyrhizobium sp. NFR13]
MIIIEPPSCGSSLVFIGKNSRGQWVAQQQNGLFGGLFVSRANAVRYALFENGHHPEAIIETASPIELDMSASSFTGTDIADMQPQRRVA